ncbi:MAG: aminotransferase class I/II-fold pyridoxal phosphate-dependent enzyme [Propionibacteriales bacterium]|nr:aminotransferase class I/II-fold pyridoxal phosphate-dependent enzyme [Propionibacteriales bacterium]
MYGAVRGGVFVTLEHWLAARAAQRDENGQTRALHPRGPASPMLDLAGNDYLGLATDPRITTAAAEAALRWGAGATASRLVTGSLELHKELEEELADFCGQPAALVFSTGYHANLGVVTALSDADTLVVSDAHIHASLVDACRLARGRLQIVPHNDVRAVDEALSTRHETRALVLCESIYSVLGDAAPLTGLAEVCRKRDATLIVDEAHAIGVAGATGRGMVHQLGLTQSRHIVLTLTLSKALGSQGGAVLGSPELVDHLVNTARPFIFDTGLAPSAAAAALRAVRMVASRPALPHAAQACAVALAESVGVDPPIGAVLSIPMLGPWTALRAQSACAQEGVLVGCFRPPSVPDGVSRLRLTASARLASHEIDHACTTLKRVVAQRVGL